MPRGYRCVILAAFGWLILVGSPEKAAAKPNQQISGQAVENSSTETKPSLDASDHTSEHDKPCAEHEDNRKSDLCAQWKAADASYSSAIWTERTFWLGISGVFVGFLTLAAAAAAAKYASDAANAARENLWHERTVIQPDLIVYGTYMQEPSNAFCTLEFNIRIAGKNDAISVNIKKVIFIDENVEMKFTPELSDRTTPKVQVHSIDALVFSKNAEAMESAAGKVLNFLIVWEYTDIIGRLHKRQGVLSGEIAHQFQFHPNRTLIATLTMSSPPQEYREKKRHALSPFG